MAVRNTKLAQELIQKWQIEGSDSGLPLDIEVCARSDVFFDAWQWIIFSSFVCLLGDGDRSSVAQVSRKVR